MGGVYVTYVADVDKGQQHVGTPVWCFKSHKQKLPTVVGANKDTHMKAADVRCPESVCVCVCVCVCE